MTDLPADVAAALTAYLAARTDDATWDAYVDSLHLGTALDVATELCLWTTVDAEAAEWIAGNFKDDPEDRVDPAVPEPPPGLQTFRTFQDYLDADDGLVYVALRREVHRDADGRRDPWNVTYRVTLEGEGWEAEGCYRAEERLAERERAHAALVAGVPSDQIPREDPWAVAACRAVCHAWAPAWARQQP